MIIRQLKLVHGLDTGTQEIFWGLLSTELA